MIPESWLRLGADIILWCQAHLSFLYIPMELFTLMGEEFFYMALIPVIYWCVDRTIGLRLLGLITLSSYINEFLKWTLHSPRPYWWEPEIQGLRAETMFCPPSGHSQNAVAFWGFGTAVLYERYGHRWLWAAFIALAFLISVSRVILGVHFPHSLVLGWTAGVIVLVAYWKLAPGFSAWFVSRSPGVQISASLAFSLCAVFAGLFYSDFLAARIPILPEWIANAAADQPARVVAPFYAKSVVSYSAVLGAMGVGTALMLRTADFSEAGPFGLRVARYILGLIGIFAIYASGKLVPVEWPEWQQFALRYVRYFVMILWAVWLAPALFLRLGLARPRTAD